jgi:hypothetical protein
MIDAYCQTKRTLKLGVASQCDIAISSLEARLQGPARENVSVARACTLSTVMSNKTDILSLLAMPSSALHVNISRMMMRYRAEEGQARVVEPLVDWILNQVESLIQNESQLVELERAARIIVKRAP